MTNLRNKTYGMVFSGGGALASWEIGCYQQIRQAHGADPIVVTGASAGALNAVGVSSNISAKDLGEIWKNVDAKDVYKRNNNLNWKNFLRLLKLRNVSDAINDFIENEDHVYNSKPLHKLVDSVLDGRYNEFESSKISFAISLSNLTHKTAEYFYRSSNGTNPVVESNVKLTKVQSLALLKSGLIGSASLPVLFQSHNGYFDGGIVLNQPIAIAFALSNIDVLYVAIPSPISLGKTDNIKSIAETLIEVWLYSSLKVEIERTKLRNFIQNQKILRAKSLTHKTPAEQENYLTELDRDFRRIVLVRPEESITDKYGVGLLDFGCNVDKLIQDGRDSASRRLASFDYNNEKTWYDV